MSSYVCVLATLSDRKQVERIAQSYPETKDFVYLWERWGHWNTDRNLPIIAVLEENEQSVGVIGFHATTFNQRNMYANNYYQAVREGWLGKGIGGSMLDYALARAHSFRLERIKFKVPKTDTLAIKFWQGFGLRPFATDRVHELYDEDIRPVHNIRELIEWMQHREQHQSVPADALRTYLRRGAVLL